MSLSGQIYALRTAHKLSQEKLAEAIGVSHQAVQRWESGVSTPDLANLVRLAQRFGVSLDMLVLEDGVRAAETRKYEKIPQPEYEKLSQWESYSAQLEIELRQCLDEGRDILAYEKLFHAVAAMPAGVHREEMAQTLYEIVQECPQRADYPYVEPSDWPSIASLMRAEKLSDVPDTEVLRDKLSGAWMGRICGCMLGKSVEGIYSEELLDVLRTTGNEPMHRYIYASDLTDALCERVRYRLRSRIYADQIDRMPADDDTNYVVLAQRIVERFGRDFTPYDVAMAWMDSQPKTAYCTAERAAYCNFVRGFMPPASAQVKNPSREWIGAQIRGDYFGYINPGDPAAAAEMAWRDASISHVKNGIYGEMFIAAILAAAAVETDIVKLIEIGLSVVPPASRFAEEISAVLSGYRAGKSAEAMFSTIHARYDEHTSHGWCHTIPNAMIVVTALLYGGGDYGRSICMAVQAAFDTDCNGATVGSILGMRGGSAAIGTEWSAPMHDLLETQIIGVGTVRISDCVEKTLSHLPKK